MTPMSSHPVYQAALLIWTACVQPALFGTPLLDPDRDLARSPRRAAPPRIGTGGSGSNPRGRCEHRRARPRPRGPLGELARAARLRSRRLNMTSSPDRRSPASGPRGESAGGPESGWGPRSTPGSTS